MSKFPIVDVKYKEYKDANPWTFDYFSEKGFLTATIKIGDRSIKVVNTHLQSSDFQRYDKYALSQLEDLLNHLEILKRDGDDYIVGGDFNIDINDIKEIKEIKEIKGIIHPTKPTIYINLTTSHTSNKYKEGYEPFIFDYFITSGLELSKPIVISSDYSDHNPVSCVFK